MFVLRPVPNREVAAISDVERAVTEIDLFLKEVRAFSCSSSMHSCLERL